MESVILTLEQRWSRKNERIRSEPVVADVKSACQEYGVAEGRGNDQGCSVLGIESKGRKNNAVEAIDIPEREHEGFDARTGITGDEWAILASILPELTTLVS